MRGTSACFLDLDLEDGVLKVWFEFSNPQNTLKIVMSASAAGVSSRIFARYKDTKDTTKQ